jgi:signal transduction histidine kinase
MAVMTRSNNLVEFRMLAGNLLAAQEEERRRVSRELHDELGQRLALLEIQIEQMERRLASDAQVTSELESLRGHVVALADDVHRICYRLHPAILENLGLIAALESYCEEYAAHSGVKTRFIHCGVPAQLPKTLALCVYRIVQETLRNVARHAHARHALVVLRGNADRIEVTIKDSGRGFDLALVRGNGLGLISLTERVHLAGGTCTILSAPGKGTRIHASLPVSVYVEPIGAAS